MVVIVDAVMDSTSKDLLEFEQPRSSSIESTLLVCSNSNRTQKKTFPSSPLGSLNLSTTSIPTSQVLDKVKNFLGVMAESNKKLEQEAKVNARENYDIEVLTGNEEEYIEMDLMLGVAELRTQAAVDAAEHAMEGSMSSILPHDNDDSDDEQNSDDPDEDDRADRCGENKRRSTSTLKKSDTTRVKKQQKITELS